MKNIRKEIYKNLLSLLYKAGAGHIGSSLSCMDILIELMLFEMTPRDRVIFSKGHAVPALYIILNHMGKISNRDLETFHKNSTKYPAHPPPYLDELVPFPSGSLGHGLSISAGIAQGIKFLNSKTKNLPRVFCIISDGECNEGQVWEAAQYASAQKLKNLVVLIDNNKLQAFGKTREVLGESATISRWKSFRFEVYKCNGHDPKAIRNTFLRVRKSFSNKPKVIIFNTIKGFGVSFMEKKIEWHYHKLTEKLYKKAILSIDKKIN